jgi:hypothetical protein
MHQRLKARLPIYPEFIGKPDYISPQLRNYVENFIGFDRLVKEGYLDEFR